jgi:hypothetical protein
MKKILSTAFSICFLSFFATAQYSVGVNSYYNVGCNFKGLENQMAFGLTASKQISTYFATDIKLLSVFSQQRLVPIIPIGGVLGICGNIDSPFYETTPSSFEMSYLFRLRPIGHSNKERITVSTGLMYRFLSHSTFPSTISGMQFVVFTPNFNRAIGIPLNIGAELDLNNYLTLSLEEENRFFIHPANKSTGDNGFNFFYYGASLNLVYHLFPKK